MSFDNIVVDDYGQIAKITFIDVDTDAAADISSYSTSQKFIFTKPTGSSVEKTGDFDTDGTDGVIKYTIDSDLFDTSGPWTVRGQVASGTALLSTVRHRFYVYPQFKEILQWHPM